MRLASILPVAAFALVLAGCTSGISAPTPGPTSARPTAQPTTTASPEPTDQPTTVDALPGGALLRVSATASVGDEEVRLALTFSRAATADNAPDAFQAVLDACPNTVESQLGFYPELEPTGVIVSTLQAEGDWPDDAEIAIAAGGLIASVGDGADVAPAVDPVGGFGCTVPVLVGPRSSTFSSILFGDPAVLDRDDLEQQIAHGIYGFEPAASSAVEIEWRDCVIQLSSVAQRLANANGWTLPAEWGNGCLIGDSGTV